MMKKIVISGIGVILPGISTMDDYRQKLMGKDTNTNSEIYELGDIDYEELCKGKDIRRTDEFTNLGLAAVIKAASDAGLQTGMYNEERTGAIISTTFGPSGTVSDYLSTIINKGIEFASPMLFPSTVINSVIGKISIDFGLKGFSSVICDANPVVYAVQKLQEGKADIIFAGAIDKLDSFIINLCKERGLFAKGLCISEGSAFAVLETLENAKRRNAKIYAEVVSYASAADKVLNENITEIDDCAVKYTMKTALQKASVLPEDVFMIEALSNTMGMAEIEEAAIKEAFGNSFQTCLISKSKLLFGEAFSVSQMCSLINTALFMEDNVGALKYAMSNSLGLGGNITSVLTGKYEE